MALSVSMFICACRPQEQQTVIPYIPIDVTLFTSDPLFIDLSVPGGSAFLNGGSRGIIVYRLDQDNFVAFDRHCTYDVNNPCGIVELNSDFFLQDFCCNSQFLITDGSVFSEPAQFPLQRYRTVFDGNTLRIIN